MTPMGDGRAAQHEPERVPDGDGYMADLDAVGVAQLRDGQLFLALHLHDGHVRHGVVADERAVELGAVEHADHHAVRVLDDVVVRENVPRSVHDDARAHPLHGGGVHVGVLHHAHADVDDPRAGVLDDPDKLFFIHWYHDRPSGHSNE